MNILLEAYKREGIKRDYYGPMATCTITEELRAIKDAIKFFEGSILGRRQAL